MVLQQLGPGGQTPAAAVGPAAPGNERKSDLAAENERRTGGRKEEEAVQPPVLKPADSVLVQADSAPPANTGGQDLDANEQARVQKLVELIRSRNPYQLDRDAQLNLPGFAPSRSAGSPRSRPPSAWGPSRP